MNRFLAPWLLYLTLGAASASVVPLKPGEARQAVQGLVREVLDALATQDFNKLASFVGGEGLIVSPYVTIDDGDVRLSRAEVERCATDPRVRHWGEKDGSGDPIEADCRRYFEEFVWSADYRRADEVRYNEPRQRGNDINNNHAFAPDSVVVELHIRGKTVATDLEWKSLRLIFRRGDRGFSLIAITRDVWTI
ncbi:hypothetical protein [Microvirga calopogonii]|uniref:hypothetical protein n=1 Tax=Microvirga calopogonii TaxID=2078013 RepID=UPI000E0D5105|nr:hypothetical protein [Microvirga calopogonii]